MTKYTVESIEETRADWGVCFVANVRKSHDTTLYRIGPAYSVKELLQKALDRFGTGTMKKSTKRHYDGVPIRQTSCRHCGQDIEGFYPYLKGEWRDRGNNTHCPNDSGKVHAPYIERR